MPKMNEMFPSKWLRSADCEDGDLTLTIAGIKQERIGQGSQADEKWVLVFKEDDRGLVLNKTNSNTICKLYGDDTDDWVGKQIMLYATEVQFQGDMVEAIRIRSKPPRAQKVAAKAKETIFARDEDEPDDKDAGIPF